MINIGVQTKGLIPEHSIDEGFRMIAEAGFTRVDFNLDNFLKNSAIYSGNINKFFDSSVEDLVLYFSEYKKAMDKYGLKPSQMHAPYPYYVMGRGQQNEYMMGNVIPKSIIIAETLGVPWIVIHPAKLQYVRGREEEHRVNMEFYQMIIPLLKQCRVGVCVENLYEGIANKIVEGTCSDPDEAIWYVDTLNNIAGEELFGMCLDSGHLQLTKRDAYTYIKKAGHRLKILHLHENDAFGDLHQMPYTFAKDRVDSLKWDEIAKGLKEINFDGTLSFETFPCMNSFIQGIESDVLDVIYAIGTDLKDKIEKA